MADKKYSEILQNPAVDTPTRKSPADVDPVMRNRIARVLEVIEQKHKVDGLSQIKPWVVRYMEKLNGAFVETQNAMANPELRPAGVSTEHLGGVMKGLLIAIDAVKQDLELLRRVEMGETHDLPDLEELRKKP